jgi:hypothetical protein
MPPWKGAVNLLDNFNAGASQALTARAAWSATEWGSFAGGISFTTDATPTLCNPNVGNATGNKTALAGQNCFAWGTWTAAGNGDQHILGTRCSGTATAQTGYAVLFTGGSTGYSIRRYVAGASTTLLTVAGLSTTVPMTMAISVVGAHVQAWVALGSGAVVWTTIGEVFDETITTPGSVAGIRYAPTGGLGASVDAVGGGVIEGDFPLPSQMPLLVSAAC